MSSNHDNGIDALLEELRSGVDRHPVEIFPVEYRTAKSMRRMLVNWSVLQGKIQSLQDNTKKNIDWSAIIDTITSNDITANRALGCMMGMVLGDSVGAPLEFLPACSWSLNHRDPQKGDSFVVFHNGDTKEKTDDARDQDPKMGKFFYINENNSFGLERGQWTDDASMGLCMAESMLARDGYHGGDVRIRFALWWFFGYCNAFRHHPHRSSVGLGGNIGKSLENLVMHYTGKKAEKVPPRFEARGEDAGNGSLMRLAPIPIRFHSDVEMAMKIAEESSYATHPGPDAANCCRFVAFFVCRAIHRPQDDGTDIKVFTEKIIQEFLSCNHLLQSNEQENVKGNGVFSSIFPKRLRVENKKEINKLQSLLQSKPPSPKEACWDWKADRLAIEETLSNRGSDYNGYPVTAGYFGSYCMDGLAMALWGLFHSTSFSECLLKVINLCGDADTTGSIAGQLAGSFYGYHQSLQCDPCGRRMMQDMRRWDPLFEIELRALLLHRDASSTDNHVGNASSVCANGSAAEHEEALKEEDVAAKKELLGLREHMAASFELSVRPSIDELSTKISGCRKSNVCLVLDQVICSSHNRQTIAAIYGALSRHHDCRLVISGDQTAMKPQLVHDSKFFGPGLGAVAGGLACDLKMVGTEFASGSFQQFLSEDALDDAEFIIGITDEDNARNIRLKKGEVHGNVFVFPVGNAMEYIAALLLENLSDGMDGQSANHSTTAECSKISTRNDCDFSLFPGVTLGNDKLSTFQMDNDNVYYLSKRLDYTQPRRVFGVVRCQEQAEPLADVLVTLASKDNNPVASAITKPDGTYEFFASPGVDNSLRFERLPFYQSGSKDHVNTLEKKSVQLDMNLVKNIGRVSGSVKDASNGTPLPGAVVTFECDSTSSPTLAKTDDCGRFAAEVISGTEVRANASVQGFLGKKGETFVVGFHETKADLEFSLQPETAKTNNDCGATEIQGCGCGGDMSF